MFAVVRTGGKQYRVAKDDVILVEKLTGEAGEVIVLDDVLAVGDGTAQTVGTPTVSGASVAARVVDQTKGDKIIVFKKKRRQGYRRRQGHRQQLTVLKVTEILTDGKKPTAAKAAAKPKAETKPAEDKTPAAETEAKKPAPKTEAKKTETKKPAAKTAATGKAAAKPKAAAKKAPAKKPAADKKK